MFSNCVLSKMDEMFSKLDNVLSKIDKMFSKILIYNTSWDDKLLTNYYYNINLFVIC